MAVDKGHAGLEQSIHHPNHGASAYNGRNSPETEKESIEDIKTKAYNEIYSLILGP
jgi:hypothetical protein